MKKAVPLDKALAMIPEGAVVTVGGFMGVGSPQRLIDELVRQRRGGPTLVCNDTARPAIGVGRLIDAGLVSKVIASHIGTNPVCVDAGSSTSDRGDVDPCARARRMSH
jgi:acetate CoA/acetoacetate CoA-transferase alpha subunit